MGSTDAELERQLIEAAGCLANASSVAEELLPVLDQVEQCLLKVEQSPAKSMQSALAPSVAALVADNLFKHPNVDVKVSVASCISEITRITAPDAPYGDDVMKDVFKLIVSSFEGLADRSSRSYDRRALILETVAKVRSCVVMLDLECDSLIVEMFQYFLNGIRDCHAKNVFTSMETIMALVLEESEDISKELLAPLLNVLRISNRDGLPIARKLAERVLRLCASKVKPYLFHAVRSLGVSVDDYSDTVASICQGNLVGVHSDDEDMVKERKLEGVSLDDTCQPHKQMEMELSTQEEHGPENGKSTKPVMSNGVAAGRESDFVADSNYLQKPVNGDPAAGSKAGTSINKAHTLDVKKKDRKEKAGPSSRRKVRKRRSSSKSAAELPPKACLEDEDAAKESEKGSDDGGHMEDVSHSPCEQQQCAADEAESSEISREVGSPPQATRSPKGAAAAAGMPTTADGAHLSPSLSRKAKKKNLTKDTAAATGIDDDDVRQKALESGSEMEAKANKRYGRKKPAETTADREKKASGPGRKKLEAAGSQKMAEKKDESEKESETTDKLGANVQEQSPPKPSKGRRKLSSGKLVSEKASTPSLPNEEEKKEKASATEMPTSSAMEEQLDESPKTASKRKRTPRKEKTPIAKAPGDDLVGSMIKVWWPMDQVFYQGVVAYFDHVKSKHKIVYDDGDEEILNLKKEKWEHVEPDFKQEEVDAAADQMTSNISSEKPQKKKSKPGKAGASASAISDHPTTKQPKREIVSPKGGDASSKKHGDRAKKGTAATAMDDDDDDDDTRDRDNDVDDGAEDEAARDGSEVSPNATAKPRDATASAIKRARANQGTPPKGVKFKPRGPRAASSEKGKAPRIGGSSSSSPDAKAEEDQQQSSSESGPERENDKENAAGSSGKEQGRMAKLARKRRRGSRAAGLLKTK